MAAHMGRLCNCRPRDLSGPVGLRRHETRSALRLRRPPSEVLRFVVDSVRLKAARYLSHNPAGGAMIIAVLVLISFTSATGHVLTTDVYWGSEFLKGVHEASAYTLIALVFVHLGGVVLASVAPGENLVQANWPP